MTGTSIIEMTSVKISHKQKLEVSTSAVSQNPGAELVSEADAALSQADSYSIQKKALWMALNVSLHQSLVLTDRWSPLLGNTFVFRCHGVACCAKLSHSTIRVALSCCTATFL